MRCNYKPKAAFSKKAIEELKERTKEVAVRKPAKNVHVEAKKSEEPKE